jgi:hypothetical protein
LLVTIPLVGNSTINYSSDKVKFSIYIPFQIENATAQFVEASPSHIGYVDPAGSGAPGNFLGSSFFLTIYDSNGNEVRKFLEFSKE